MHESAKQGFASGATAYAAGRPGYPAEIVGWLQSQLGLERGKTVLDLGAGTGKFLASLRQTAADITAVEPVSEMRELLMANNPDVRTLAGSAEAIPLADGSMDAVVSAQAFHWFANAQALTEIRRVLKPGGSLGLVWNVRDENVDWVAALTQIMAPYEGSAPHYHSGEWRNAFPAPGFGPLREQLFSHEHAGPPEQVILNRVLSVSFIAALPSEEQESVAARVRQLIDSFPAIARREQVAFPYQTIAFHCTKMS